MKTVNSLIYQLVCFLVEKYITGNNIATEERIPLRDFKEWLYFELELDKN